MSVLMMVLKGPMQSWGSSSRFTRRETEMMPTKSGVVGMIAAALGVGRTESLSRFSGLRFGVRADQPGTVLSDYHTAMDEHGKMLPLSTRFYIQDAVFVVGVEGDRDSLENYAQALRTPFYQLFLGRRSCPPAGPIETWITEGSLESALSNAPWKAADWYRRRVLSTQGGRPLLEMRIEPTVEESTESGVLETLSDEPVNFNPERRQWKLRRYRRSYEAIPGLSANGSGGDAAVPTGSGELSDLNDVDFFNAVRQEVE